MESTKNTSRPPVGTEIRIGKNEKAILESYSTDGRRYEVRRIRNGKPAKSTSWYEGTPR